MGVPMAVSMIMLLFAANAAAKDPTMPIGLTVHDSADAKDFEVFLRQRAMENWPNLELRQESAGEGFMVTLSWPSSSTVLVHVAEAGVEIAHREIAIADVGAAKLTVWLVVKSALERALRVASEPQPAKPVELSTTKMAIKGSQHLTQESQAQEWGMAVLVGMAMGAPQLFHVGPAFALWSRPWHRLWLAGEIGYALTPGVVLKDGNVGLLIHHIPVRLLTAWQLDGSQTFAAGAYATAEVKFAVTHATSQTAVGVDVGAFIQAQIPLSASRSHFSARVAVGMCPLRHRYILDDETLEERPWIASISSGVAW